MNNINFNDLTSDIKRLIFDTPSFQEEKERFITHKRFNGYYFDYCMEDIRRASINAKSSKDILINARNILSLEDQFCLMEHDPYYVPDTTGWF
jgi:hypothetical protein